jgi:hypothetical protein
VYSRRGPATAGHNDQHFVECSRRRTTGSATQTVRGLDVAAVRRRAMAIWRSALNVALVSRHDV